MRTLSKPISVRVALLLLVAALMFSSNISTVRADNICTNAATVQSISGAAIIYKSPASERKFLKVGDIYCDEDRLFMSEAAVIKLAPLDGSQPYELFSKSGVSAAAIIGLIALVFGLALIFAFCINAFNSKNMAAKVAMYLSALIVGYELYFMLTTSAAFIVLYVPLGRA